jgi:Ca-activated chloride channel family protein
MRRVAFLMTMFLLASLAFAQKKPDRPGPILTVGENAKPLAISKAQVRVVIAGFLAETSVTLTFQNDLDRVLEGQLSFPLPDGAVVSGYGLDVKGQMVEGVPVEKLKARVTYEKEVRKGVDPGLVEHVVGNNFRTRVYPIPARGSRTVKIQYVSDLAEMEGAPAYRMGMDWGQAIGEYDIKIQMMDLAGNPSLQSGPEGLKLEQAQGKVIAEKTYQNVQFKNDLVISLPEAPKQHCVVEKRLSDAGDAEYYFVIHDSPDVIRVRREMRAVGRVGIAWDASLSRSKADHQREIALLRAAMGSLKPMGIDLVIFRNKPEAVVRVGNVEEAIKLIEAAPYDGGTNLADVKLGKECTFWMLFTDGLGDLYADRPKVIESQVYAISNDAKANPGLLEDMAGKSGGQYFNLKRVSNEQVVLGMENSPYALISVTYDPNQISEVYPTGARAVSGRMAVSGKLRVPEAKITLNYGFGGQVFHAVSYTLSQASGTQTGQAARFWAQQKIGELSVFAEKNKGELEKIGREFGLVTPNTSLMVLETVEQYLQYKITPPKTRGDVYAAYMEKAKALETAQESVKKDKMERLVQEWEERVKWWEMEHKYPKDFRYVDIAGAVGRFVGGLGGGGNAAPAGEARPAAAPVVNDPAPARRARGGGRGGGGQGLFGGASADSSPQAYVSDLDAVSGKKDGKDDGEFGGPSIAIKPWDPETPYLITLRESKGDPYPTYLAQRQKFGDSPAFYLDCADYFLRNDQRELGIRILTNVAELELDSAPLMRIAAQRLMQIGETEQAIDLFEKVLASRPEEPQSYRDLALALMAQADAMKEWDSSRLRLYARALDLLHQVVMGQWDRFAGIEIVALMEANALWEKMHGVPQKDSPRNPFDPRLVKNLDLDIRVVLTWDADLTDMDLWVTEPSGEKCVYDHNRTVIGGLLSNDFTQGYGPEEYCLRKAMPGVYKIQANYYGSGQQTLAGPATVQATVITDFGRPTEKRQALTVRLEKAKEVVDIGTIKISEKGIETAPAK